MNVNDYNVEAIATATVAAMILQGVAARTAKGNVWSLGRDSYVTAAAAGKLAEWAELIEAEYKASDVKGKAAIAPMKSTLLNCARRAIKLEVKTSYSKARALLKGVTPEGEQQAGALAMLARMARAALDAGATPKEVMDTVRDTIAAEAEGKISKAIDPKDGKVVPVAPAKRKGGAK